MSDVLEIVAPIVGILIALGGALFATIRAQRYAEMWRKAYTDMSAAFDELKEANGKNEATIKSLLETIQTYKHLYEQMYTPQGGGTR